MADRKAFLKLARDRFEQAQEAEKSQRQREKDDLEFYAGDQWPKDIKIARGGQQASIQGLPPVPARPMITINKTREPVRQVLNQERQSDMGIEIVPADDFAELVGPIDETEIELREGLVRRIQRESNAADARTWAFARAVQAGRGFYGVMTRYVPGKTNDQEIYIRRFFNQSCVTLDPAHTQPDGSDAEWGFVGTDMAWDRYKAKYAKRNGKKNRICSAGKDTFRAFCEDKPGWFKDEGDLRMARVVEYWYTEHTPRELVTFQDESGEHERVEWADELDGLDELDGWTEIDRRLDDDKQIKFAIIDGCDDDVLEETDWLGPDLPLVKVLGEELQPYDEERRTEGMVRPMRGPGESYNYMITRWVELIGLAPLSPVMIEEGTIEGYEPWWQAANTRVLPYLLYKRKNLDGQEGLPPTVPPARNPDIGAIAASVQVFDEALRSSSGVEAAALGQADASVRSNKQARLLVEQSKQGTSHYLDNLQRSERYEAQIINNLLYPIYGRRPGRLARLIDPEGEASSVLLHQPMIVQNGKPVAAPDGHKDAKTYTLTKDAKFNVAIKISKSYDTRRQEQEATLGELIQAEPQLMTWFGDLFFKSMDAPGHNEMADRVKVMLDPKIQQVLAAKAQGTTVPPEVQAQLSSAQAQIQQLQQQLQEASKPGAVEQIKQRGQLQAKDMDLQFQREKAQADNETKIAVAELGAKVDRLALFLEERARLGVQDQAQADRAHEVGMAAMDHAHATAQADQGSGLAMDQAAHQQAIQPPPEHGAEQ